ncbi:hypothetical protein L596_008473 [Steinernema carpocapsae]|uniref:Uncharacterized protein n=1 Tax=Steinernema carpocapsae TaxID=34508 RepID=A0A4U5PCL4_STECR|nr:hypothetical protein L596_008473 [Steinernema carpocapsae]
MYSRVTLLSLAHVPFHLVFFRLLISAITRAAAWTGARRVFLCPPEESVTPPPLRRSSAPPRDQGERKLVQHENKCRRKTRSERVRKKKTTGNLRVAIRPPAVRVMRCHPRAACACIAQHLWKDGRDEEVLEGWKSVFEGFG